jgi:hypothetical protein
VQEEKNGCKCCARRKKAIEKAIKRTKKVVHEDYVRNKRKGETKYEWEIYQQGKVNTGEEEEEDEGRLSYGRDGTMFL